MPEQTSFRFIGCIYSISSFLRHLCDMLSPFPEKLVSGFWRTRDKDWNTEDGKFVGLLSI